jgi:ubiquinone/menaquinone biosynthesis C-methylase UbiE
MSFYRRHIVPHLVNLAMRNGQLLPYRERLLAKARGRVLEVGVGSGVNLPLYPRSATEIIGLDPSPKLLAMAADKTARVPVSTVEGVAENIPLEDDSFDTVVMTWTLCSIPDAMAALREMRRVLKPSGQLLFIEHGLSPDPAVRKWQHRLTPMWKRFTGGCHLDRPISEFIENAGFQIANLENGYLPGPKPLTYLYEGSAQSSQFTS